MPLRTPPRWFIKELSLINPGLKVAWSDRARRWLIYNPDGSVSHRVEHPKTKVYRDLDQRILRKIRIDSFFTHNEEAMMLFVDSVKEEKEINRELRQYLNRGLDGISDYLSGWDRD